MSCFSCVSPGRKDGKGGRPARTVGGDGGATTSHNRVRSADSLDIGDLNLGPSVAGGGGRGNGGAVSFTYKQLAIATHSFRETNMVGEGGFGKVYRGHLDSGQVVAIKQLNQNGLQGSKEFLVEVLMLIMLRHPNLVSLIGFCMEGEERLLVYEYMFNGSLEKHLFDIPAEKEPLDWNTRIKVALGAAKGVAYLHDVASPPVIYRDLKSANILLDEDFTPKLSDFGLAKLGPVGDKTHVSTRVMGTYGYCAPEYAMSGRLTVKSDVYSFGVVLLELITGRRAYDPNRPAAEQNLIALARPYIHVSRKFIRFADPLLHGRFPRRSFCQFAAITAACLSEQSYYRPNMRDVVLALEHVASRPYVSDKDRRFLSPTQSSPARMHGS